MLHFLLKSRQIVITLPFKVFFCALFFVQYSLTRRKSTLFIKKNYLNNVYLQKNKPIQTIIINASPIWAFGVLAMPQAKQVILSDVKDHSGPHNL